MGTTRQKMISCAMLIVVVAVMVLMWTRRHRYVEVSVRTPSGWYVTILPDGSGSVGYGALIAWTFPAGTMPFDDIVDKLRAAVRTDGTIATDYGVAFWKPGRDRAVTWCIRDRDIVRAIFERAHGALDAEFVDNFWERPLQWLPEQP
jgi:hypothetical protein